MSWNQPKGCTCKWDGDDHYNSLVKWDSACPVHEYDPKGRLKGKEEVESPCPYCHGTGVYKYWRNVYDYLHRDGIYRVR